MKDQTLIALLAAKRAAVRSAEPFQAETSKKLVSVPQGVWDKLLEAAQAVLQEEIDS